MPRQENGSDCGVFVLEYAEWFVKNFTSSTLSSRRVAEKVCPDVFQLRSPQLAQTEKAKSWGFSQTDITHKRKEVLELLQKLAAKHEPPKV